MKQLAPLRRRHRVVLAALTAVLATIGVWRSRAADGALAEPLARPALVTPRAAGAALLSVTAAGDALVAVGERGIVLRSEDGGATWRQSPTPVSITLTAVRFVDADRGWAIGHGGVVLHSADGGKTWTGQLDGRAAAALALKAAPQEGSTARRNAQRLVADGADKPLLDLHFFDARRGFVVGAYGIAYGTEDGGATWSPWFDRIDNPQGLHLNAIAVRGDRVLLVGERGLLLLSTDGGRRFARVASPYEGSWFAAAPRPKEGGWLLAGLRGHIHTCDETLARCAESAVPMPVSIASVSVLPDGRMFALNQAGQALVSRDDGRRFEPLALTPGAPMTALVPLPDGRLVASSLRGMRSLPPMP